VIRDALHVGLAHERLVTAAAFRAAGRTRDVLRQILEVFAREVDDLADRLHEFRIVVVLIDPLALGNFVGIVVARRFFVVRNRDVFFGDLDLGDMLHRLRVEELRVGRLSRTFGEIAQADEVDGFHSPAEVRWAAGAAWRGG